MAGRRAAVDEAVRLAAPGDVVALLGKGHERGQEVNGEVLPFDDRIELRKALEAPTPPGPGFSAPSEGPGAGGPQ